MLMFLTVSCKERSNECLDECFNWTTHLSPNIFNCRLAKLLSQVEWSRTGINFIIDTTYYPWIMKRELTPPLPEEGEEELIMRKFYVSLGQVKSAQRIGNGSNFVLDGAHWAKTLCTNLVCLSPSGIFYHKHLVLYVIMTFYKLSLTFQLSSQSG